MVPNQSILFFLFEYLFWKWNTDINWHLLLDQILTSNLYLQVKTAPEVCWKPSRLLSDLQLSQDLILKLDEEKGISENTLVPKPKKVEEEVKKEDEKKEGKEENEDASKAENSVKEEDTEMQDIRPSEDVNGASVKIESKSESDSANPGTSKSTKRRSLLKTYTLEICHTLHLSNIKESDNKNWRGQRTKKDKRLEPNIKT